MVATVDRSAVSRERSTSLAAQDGESVMLWKYTNGLCRAAYWSPTFAFWVSSGAFAAGCRQGVPMSSM